MISRQTAVVSGLHQKRFLSSWGSICSVVCKRLNVFSLNTKWHMYLFILNGAICVCCRVCELLQSGAVMNKSYQPHEGHIPYLLQLFIDYNLYGMNLVNLAAVKFRSSQKKGKGRESTDFRSCLLLFFCLSFLSVFSSCLVIKI